MQQTEWAINCQARKLKAQVAEIISSTPKGSKGGQKTITDHITGHRRFTRDFETKPSTPRKRRRMEPTSRLKP